MNIVRAVVFFAALVLVFGAPQKHAQAETTLYLEPATGLYPIGQTFNVEVLLDTDGEAISAADGTVTYSPDDLEVVSLSTADSVFSSWLVTPVVNESEGTIRFQGLLSAQRTYSGSNGRLLTITFRALKKKASQVWFSQGAAVVAADGSGANVLENLRAATYTLTPKEVVPALGTAVLADSTETGIEITPIPLPSDEWFATSSVKLSWTLPPSVTEMRTLVSDLPYDEPTKTYAVPVSAVSVGELAEGTHYFHLQFRFGDEWGPATHYPLRVDLTPPEYVIVSEAERKDRSDPRVRFIVDANDLVSGIGRYEAAIDDGPPIAWERPQDGMYWVEQLEPGEYTLSMTAYDRAGHASTTSILFQVKALESPVLTNAPHEVIAGNTITVTGSTYPNSTVTVFTALNDNEPDERTLKSDREGTFVATLTENARPGTYAVWFQVADSRGAMSEPSLKRSIDVRQPLVVLVGNIAVNYLSIIIPLVGLVLLLGLILWYGYTFIRTYRARVLRETTDADSVVQREFHELRDHLRKEIGNLEKAKLKRELTREEMRILTALGAKLDHIEERIRIEISDIEPSAVTDEYQEQLTPARASPPSKHTVKVSPR